MRALKVEPAIHTEDWIAARSLLADYIDWLSAAVGVDPFEAQPALADELNDLPGHYDRPGASLLLARDVAGAGCRQRALGMVAVVDHDDGRVELKRLYVSPRARGRAVGQRLVGEAVTRSQARGRTALWLETVRGVMDPAISVYRRHGFEEAAEADATIHGVPDLIVMERPAMQRPVMQPPITQLDPRRATAAGADPALPASSGSGRLA